MLPAGQRHEPVGPDASWPTGNSELEYRGDDQRYPAPQAAQPPAIGQGQHPYAAFNASGYGDDGYNDPGYQGPSAQDAGIAGTRTVRGFVEPRQVQGGYQDPGYPETGYPQSGYAQGQDYPQEQGYGGPTGYAGSSYLPAGEIEMAYPPVSPSAEEYHGADSYRQPWDYGQPLRYEDEVAYTDPQDGYQAHDGYQAAGDYGHGDYRGGHDAMADGPGRDDGVGYHPQSYNPSAYNGSEYSRPGIEGAGYDLSGIIGTSDFEVVGYDEPSYDRLSYDDPRYEDAQPRYDDPQGGRPRFDEGRRFDTPRYDDTRLDNLWLPGDDARHDVAPAGYGNDGFSTDGPVRSGYSDLDRGGQGYRFDETRLDMSASAVFGMDHTRFDVPAFDETRLDNLRSAVMLAPPAGQPRNWADDTSLDHFADLDLTDEPVPAAFTRTLDRPEADEDTASRRAVGRRRGRSGDRRQWMALGAIAVVAVGAIGCVLMKYVFAGPSGPAHEVAAVNTVDGYTRSANLEKQMKVSTLAETVSRSSSGSASDVQSAVYQMGGISPGGNAQIFMFVGGKLAGADPSSSIANFEQSYPNARAVATGSLGGDAACTESVLNGGSAAMCVWFDNDTFGAFVSPTMTTAKLATVMEGARPSLELHAK